MMLLNITFYLQLLTKVNLRNFIDLFLHHNRNIYHLNSISIDLHCLYVYKNIVLINNKLNVTDLLLLIFIIKIMQLAVFMSEY